MCDSHLCDSVCDDESDDCAEEIRKDDPRSCETYCDGAAEKKPYSDCSADGHHGELTLREGAAEFCRTLTRAGSLESHRRAGGNNQFTAPEPCQGVPSRIRESHR